jgi:hypothetical protein
MKFGLRWLSIRFEAYLGHDIRLSFFLLSKV